MVFSSLEFLGIRICVALVMLILQIGVVGCTLGDSVSLRTTGV